MKIILLLVGFITTVKGGYIQEFLGSFYQTPATKKDVYIEPDNNRKSEEFLGSFYEAADTRKDTYIEPDNNYRKSEGRVGGSLPCGTDLHTCVPNSDCNEHNYSGAKICHPAFEKIGGACYYISNDKQVRNQSRPQAWKFCEALGGVVVNFESREEFNDLSARIPSGTLHWTEGFYKPYTSSWVWETSKEDINFKFVHPETGRLKGIKDPEHKCLSFNDTGLYPTFCFENIPFVCKDGYYDNNCEKYGSNKCCFTPLYDYYITHLQTVHNQNVETTRSPCFVTYNTQATTCADAYKSIKGIPAKNFRFENSIYYVMPANEGCGKDIEAIISSNDLHTLIVRILSLRYLSLLDIKLRIGLHGTEMPTQIEFKWANGKSVDFYEGKYWALGHPRLQSMPECVMYELTGEDGTYLWHTQEAEAVCNDQDNFVLCQLPIRSHDYKQNLKKEEGCGERKSRGVLGRSYSFTSAVETNFGELPWQAAISVSTFYGGAGLKFACSGVLISYDSIITSSHCAIQAGESMVISLGDYDLLGANRRKLLYPEYRTAAESIINPGYRAWNPGYQPGKNDIAIIRISEAVNYNAFPHIGISCLPTHSLLYGSGDWECYMTGWSQPKLDRYDHTQVLSRIEVEFTSREKCYTATSKLSTSSQYNYFYGPRHYGRTQSNLLCVEAEESGSCIDDNTAILICKKRQEYLDDPFGLDSVYYDDYAVSSGGRYGSQSYGSQSYGSQSYGSQSGGQYGSQSYGSQSGGQYGSQSYGSQSGGQYGSQSYGSQSLNFRQHWDSGVTRIINSYVQERSDNDRWYLMGIGHGSNRCDGSSNIMLFEPVHEHIAFIHANVDLVEQE